MTAFTTELVWLTATAAMTGLFWVPYILNRLLEHGFVAALWDPVGNTSTQKPWADRMRRAHNNAIENLCIFAVLVLVQAIVGVHTDWSILSIKVYFFARLGHFIVYSAAIPVLRVLCFLAGFACQAVLAWQLLGAMG